MNKRLSTQIDEKSLDIVNHDHKYLQYSGEPNICDEGIDAHEEEIGSKSLPKNVIPIDRHRLVVELGHIINQLKTGCVKCRLPLNICGTQGVLTRGLGGWIYVTCDNPICATMNKVSLGKQHKKIVPQKDNPYDLIPPGSAIFDINTKAALGMLHAGIGEMYLNNLLCTLNLPQISHKSLKVREVKIGCVMQDFANKSVDAALRKEQELTQSE